MIGFIPAFHACGANSELKRLGSYRTAGPVQDVAVSGNYAYVAEGKTNYLGPAVPIGWPEKLLAIDVRNPEKPQKAGEYTAGLFSGFAVSGNYAYLLETRSVYGRTADSLVGIDISNPSNPRRVRSYSIANPFGPPGYAVHMAASSNYVCVTTLYDVSRIFSSETFSSLLVLDISDPSNPKGPTVLFEAGEVSGIGQPLTKAHYSGPLAIAGNYAYQPPKILDLASRRQVGSIETGVPLRVFGSYLYLNTDRGLTIIDIRNPEKPQKAGEYAGWVSDVAVSGNYAYLAKGSFGLEVIDITDVAKPVPVGGNSTINDALRVTVAGGRVYVAAPKEGLIILDEYRPEAQSQIRFDQVSRGSQGELRLRLVGPTGVNGRLQRSTNLREWIDWKGVNFTDAGIDFSDPEVSSARQRFYRVIAP